MSSVTSREEAQELVQNISASHGYVDEQHWEAMGDWDMERKRVFELAFLRKDTLIGSTVITLAKNLYSTNARFLFELIQNCEDNSYQKATERGEEPFVFFKVHSDRVIVDCNEDGFTKQHLASICNIGKSSKRGTQAYIGEKGIGFKSVFKVAYKAVIQSGHFCFSFTHRKGDSGMGMISPQWEEDQGPAPRGRTRITLWLHEDEDFNEASISIREQFATIHEEMLLFMRKLKKIMVKVYDSEHQVLHSSTYSRYNGAGQLVSTQTLRKEGANESRTTKHFYLISFEVTGLPKSETRDYDDEALGSESYASSEIVLAFPLDENSEPILKKQWLFSFLPVLQTGFKFIIQADFVTSASRENIETTSPRNRVLGQLISRALIEAILRMCEHETLQYQWMRYLPSTDEHAWGPFWTAVIHSFNESLESVAVLRPASLGPLRRISEMRTHSRLELDRDNRPLFPDITPEKYPSRRYKYSDLKILQDHGLIMMNMEEVIDRVKHDLQATPSCIKSCESEDWHTRTALLLQQPFKREWQFLIHDLENMKFLPLRDGNWTSINDGAVYYADLGNLTIPQGLQLRVLGQPAGKNPERRKLFDYLGVQIASVDLVREQIRQRYRQPGSWSLPFTQSLADLHFMYLTHDASRAMRENLAIDIITSDKKIRDPTLRDIYLPSEDHLSACQLLASTPSGPCMDDGAPGHSFLLLDNYYLDHPPVDPPATLPKWLDWLHDALYIRRHLRLKDKSSDSLSDACQYVAKHRPQKFMSLLKKLWQVDSSVVRVRPTFTKQLRNLEVLCRGGRFYKLSDTFLPTTQNEELASRFLTREDPFRWLQLDSLSGHECRARDWEQVASALQFGHLPNDINFGLSILSYLQGKNQVDSTAPGKDHSLSHSTIGSEGHRRVHDLYVFLEAQVRGSKDEKSARRVVQQSIADDRMVFVPAGHRSKRARWVGPKQCFWKAPVRSLIRMHALEALYTDRPGEIPSSSGGYSLGHFFRNVVDVAVWDSKYAIDEIKAQKEGDANFYCVIELYRWLSKSRPSKKVSEDIRHAFESEGLVYKPRDKDIAWHRSSDCLWTTATTIPGKIPINNDGDYDGLESFFLDVIGVQKMTLQMLHDKLSAPGLSVPLDELKGDLLEFSALLAGNESDKIAETINAVRIRKSRIFPVRKPDGEVCLLTGDEHFAIIDRAPFAKGFRDKAQFLDFDIQQVRRLEHFVLWTGLQNRYLSTSVREIFVPDRSSTRPVSEPQRQIGRKAGALLRIAIDCGSPRIANGFDDFFRMLQNCKTLETKSIATTWLLHQGGKEPITHKQDDGIALHIDGNSEPIKVFVPRKKADREACFQSKLPRHLLEWIMSDPDTNITEAWGRGMTELFREQRIRAVQAVLSSPSSALKLTLEEYGIPVIDVAYDDEVDDDDDDEDDTQWEELSVVEDDSQHRYVSSNHRQQEVGSPREEEDSNSHHSTALSDTKDERPALTLSPSTRSVTPLASVGDDASTSVSIITRRENLRSVSASVQPIDQNPPEPAHQPLPAVVPPQSTPYQLMLQQVVDGARSITFPSRGPFDMSAISQALSEPARDDPAVRLPFLRPFGRLERDKMVGAAGELFVFELLSCVQPPLADFDIANWQSNIRGYVNAHPDYADISSWRGPETADITYRDHTGALTSFLADKGYLEGFDVEGLRQAEPLYYLEVKSTPYPYETSTFFMNRSQYRRMQDCSQSVPGQEDSVDRVYIVMRVFNLGKESASLKVLVDPEGMRRRGELDFEAESWRVRPNMERPGGA